MLNPAISKRHGTQISWQVRNVRARVKAYLLNNYVLLVCEYINTYTRPNSTEVFPSLQYLRVKTI